MHKLYKVMTPHTADALNAVLNNQVHITTYLLMLLTKEIGVCK